LKPPIHTDEKMGVTPRFIS